MNASPLSQSSAAALRAIVSRSGTHADIERRAGRKLPRSAPQSLVLRGFATASFQVFTISPAGRDEVVRMDGPT